MLKTFENKMMDFHGACNYLGKVVVMSTQSETFLLKLIPSCFLKEMNETHFHKKSIKKNQNVLFHFSFFWFFSSVCSDIFHG